MLIHGSWGDHHNWDLVVPELSNGFRVVAYDRRGHSESERVTTQGSYEEDADDAAALIVGLGLAPAHVVGNSGGSAIALKLAAKHPTVLRSLVVHEPPLFGILGEDPATAPMLAEGKKRGYEVAQLLEKGDLVGGARLFAETLAFGPGGWDRLPLRIKETFIRNALTYLDETKDPMALTVDMEGLQRYVGPTLMSYGGKSPPHFRPVVEKLAIELPGSKVHVYPQAGHTPHISHPSEFVGTITDFVRS